MPRNRSAAAIRINAPLFVEFVDVECGAVSGAMTIGSTAAKASSVDARAGVDACATFAAVGGGEVAAIAASGTAGAAEATGVGSGELLGTDERVGSTASSTGLDELLEVNVGRGVIVAPTARRGVTTMLVLDGRVGSTSSVAGCVVGVAVGDGTVVGVLVAGPAKAEIGP